MCLSALATTKRNGRRPLRYSLSKLLDRKSGLSSNKEGYEGTDRSRQHKTLKTSSFVVRKAVTAEFNFSEVQPEQAKEAHQPQ